MNEKKDSVEGRRSLITGLGIAAAGVAAAASMPAHAQRSRGFVPARHSLDAWLDELPGEHRVFVDSATAHGGAEALLYSNNLYAAHQSAYSGSPEDFAMVVCFRHFSTPFGYDDAAWEKYGEQFMTVMQFENAALGKAPKFNPMNATDVAGLPNFGMTVDSVTSRGAQIAICNNATRFVSTQIAAATGASADDVFEELHAHAVTNGRFVPAGVLAATRAQEYGYSFLYAG
jgi:hypothetical protein